MSEVVCRKIECRVRFASSAPMPLPQAAQSTLAMHGMIPRAIPPPCDASSAAIMNRKEGVRQGLVVIDEISFRVGRE